MYSSVILLSILGMALATPVEVTKLREVLLSKDALTRNSVLENLLLGLLEDLRGTMLTGSDDVPVLDPLELEQLNVDDTILPLPGAQVNVNGAKVSKLSTFVVDTLNVNSASIILQRYRIEFDFYVPVLEINADKYDLSVSVAGTNIFGNGDANINLIEPRVKGSLLVAPRFSIGSGIYLTILNSEVKLELKGFESQINGLLNDDSLSDFINTFLKYFVPELVEALEDDITKILSETVQEIGNELLANLNLADILG